MHMISRIVGYLVRRYKFEVLSLLLLMSLMGWTGPGFAKVSEEPPPLKPSRTTFVLDKWKALKASCEGALRVAVPPLPVEPQKFKKDIGRESLSVLFPAGDNDPLQIRRVNGLQKTLFKLDRLSDFAYDGLLKILTDRKLSILLVRQLARLGLLRTDGSDELYAKMFILAKNEPVDLTRTHDDPAVQAFLESQYAKLIDGQIRFVIQNVSYNNERTSRLLEMFSDAINRLDNSALDSILNLDQVLMEINRLKIQGRLTPDTFEKSFMILSGMAKYRLLPLQLPPWLTAPLATMLPSGSGLAFLYWNQGVQKVQDKMAKSGLIDVDQAPVWKTQIPNSLVLKFKKSDVLDLRDTVDRFIDKYSDRKSPLFTPQFAEDFFAAYPEVRELKKTTGFEGTNIGDMVDGPFGYVSREQQRLLFRATLFFSVVRNDNTPFNRITHGEFSLLRMKILSDLGFLEDRLVDHNEIDLYLTFFIIESLGRLNTSISDALSSEFRIARHVNEYDFERRASFLLRRFAFLSYSFARQKPNDQNMILALQDGAFMFNMEHILNLDGSELSFRALRDLDRKRMSFLFYRNLISYAAQDAETDSHAHFLTSERLRRWFKLKNILDRSTDDINDAESFSVHEQYVNWVAKNRGISLEGSEYDRTFNLTLLRLSSIAMFNHAQQMILESTLRDLKGEDRLRLIKYYTKLPAMIVNGTGFYLSFQEFRLRSGNITFAQSVDLWLKGLTRIFELLDRTQAWRLWNPNTVNFDIRFFVEPLARAVETWGPKAIDAVRIHYDLEHHTVIVSVDKSKLDLPAAGGG